VVVEVVDAGSSGVDEASLGLKSLKRLLGPFLGTTSDCGPEEVPSGSAWAAAPVLSIHWSIPTEISTSSSSEGVDEKSF
jgi:hypothetical protein